MKAKLLVLSVIILAAFGCQHRPSDALKLLPPGEYASATVTVTGKFSATSGSAADVVVTEAGQVTYGKVHLRHSNAWVPLIEVDAESKEHAAKSK